MPSVKNQKEVFEFFVQYLESKESFLLQDIKQRTTWSEKTFETYFNKQLCTLLVPVEDEPGKYRVSEAFRRYSNWENFRQYVTQVRTASVDYTHVEYETVRIYEFFMPLTNETYLRAALDTLFYKDTVEARLKTIDTSKLLSVFPKEPDETSADYNTRLCNWLSDKFGGYSIYHVNGRFRALPLTARDDIPKSARYLVDETTAVTRFIFPCRDDKDAKRVEFFFHNLFVRAIIEIVNGEDEIWMVETGVENRLHIWRASSQVRPKTTKQSRKKAKQDHADPLAKVYKLEA